ncbi:thioesterase domain-containing protein [Metabacillus idriensis]|uniref:thioesterase II family protein n=1 Tax=Metabacillus idriensis TaxID=324768 RepID=UPI0017495564|nr:thioesterase [Metabacillus idriensis]MCM3598087.1 thioesterase domain-containing protein [Metabacillus idriensis]
MEQVILFCLPYAGSSASIYYKWNKYLDDSILLHPIELKGRGKRIKEPFYNSIEEAIEDVYTQVKPFIDRPFSFYGHSMGSVLVYELCCKLKREQNQSPKNIFVSGRKAPQCTNKSNKIHLFDDEDFKNEIRKLGGTPEEIIQNEEYFNFFKPVIRADYKIIEEYKYQREDFKLDCNIMVLNGKEDNITEKELFSWQELTSKECEILHFEGGHFFINDHTEEVVKVINNKFKTANYRLMDWNR